MRTILLAVLSFNLCAHADRVADVQQSPVTAASEAEVAINAPDLRSTMKQMGAQIKILAEALLRNEEKPMAELVKAARLLRRLVHHGRAQIPEGADASRFQTAMDNLAQSLAALEQQLVANDKATAATVLRNQVLPHAKSGHQIFRKN